MIWEQLSKGFMELVRMDSHFWLQKFRLCFLPHEELGRGNHIRSLKFTAGLSQDVCIRSQSGFCILRL